MKKINLLILTDHHKHSSDNSLYDLVCTMIKHPNCAKIDIANRGNLENESFFKLKNTTTLHVVCVTNDFSFEKAKYDFEHRLSAQNLKDYDFIFLRLSRPLDHSFFDFLLKNFNPKRIFNAPLGIEKTGSKAFLLQVSQLCAPIKQCQTIEEIRTFAKLFPIVLKPLDNYGGAGIVKVEGDKIKTGNETFSFDEYLPQLEKEMNNGGYLAMKFLKNVTEGDKRIIVVNGKIVGKALRKPSKDTWLCNASQGGSSHATEITMEEQKMATILSPILKKHGIVMFGFDTLMDDNGKRVLSEINTSSIGGLKQAEQLSKEPVLERVSNELWDFMLKF